MTPLGFVTNAELFESWADWAKSRSEKLLSRENRM